MELSFVSSVEYGILQNSQQVCIMKTSRTVKLFQMLEKLLSVLPRLQSYLNKTVTALNDQIFLMKPFLMVKFTDREPKL